MSWRRRLGYNWSSCVSRRRCWMDSLREWIEERRETCGVYERVSRMQPRHQQSLLLTSRDFNPPPPPLPSPHSSRPWRRRRWIGYRNVRDVYSSIPPHPPGRSDHNLMHENPILLLCTIIYECINCLIEYLVSFNCTITCPSSLSCLSLLEINTVWFNSSQQSTEIGFQL